MAIDLETARRRLPAWFATRLPGATDIVVSSLSAPGAGSSNETYFVTVSYKRDGEAVTKDLVIRWPPTGFLVFPADSYDMARQYELLRCLQPTAAPTPGVFGVETDPSVLGAPFFLMEKVSGWIPGDFPPYHREGRLFDASAEDREQVWWSGLEAVAAIHAVDWQSSGLDMLGVPETADYLDQQIALYDAVLAQNDEPIPELLAATRQWLLDNRFTPSHHCLCWGDARIGNMVFQDQEVVAALDWEMAAIGDPVADLAWYIHVDWAASEGRPAAPTPRLAGLPGPAETIARYEAITGRAVENFAFYDVLAAYRLAVVYTRIEQDATYLARSGNVKGHLTTTHFEKLSQLIGR
jgi:aminoglycoside phosphotransferase (APT) family kinase protein